MTPKKYSERKRDEQRAAHDETVGIILIIVSAFLLFCMITQDLILGVIGSALCNLFLGIIGYSAYPIFLYLLVYGILKIKGRKITASTSLVVGVILSLLSVALIAHLATSSNYLGSFSRYLSGVYYGKDTVGGLFFGLITYLFEVIFGVVVSYVVYSLVLIFGLFLIVRAIGGGDAISTDNLKKTIRQKKTNAHRSEGAQLVPQKSGGLFVGNIIKSKPQQTSSEGTFDQLKENETDYTAYDPEMPEEEYRRKRAREILFSGTENFTFSMPAKAVSTPDVKRESKPATPKYSMPEVHIPKPKNFEYNYIEGEIINGDALSEAKSAQDKLENQVKAEDTTQYVQYTSSTLYGNEQDDAPIVPGPIVNGDLFVAGKGAPPIDEKYYEPIDYNTVSTENDTVESTQNEQPEQEEYYDFSVQNNQEQTYVSPEFDESEQENDFGVSSYDEIETPEENDDVYSYQEETAYDDNEGIVNGDEFEQNQDGEFELEPVQKSEQENVYDDFSRLEVFDDEEDERIEAVSDEDGIDQEELSDDGGLIITDDTSLYDELTQEDEQFEVEPENEFVSFEPIANEQEEKAKELSDKFDATTTSFNIVDEVEDLSETGFSNENDSTGYYNQVEAPVSKPTSITPSFEKRVDELEKNIRPVAPKKVAPEQMDIVSFATENARKRQEESAVEQKPKTPKKPKKYVPPPLDLLVTESTHPETENDDTQSKIELLEQSLEGLGVPAKVNGVTVGPAITRYEMDMPPGMSVKKIENLADDIRYNLASKGQVRIESPIPGKRAVGIEVPNDTIYTVALKDIIGSPEFKASTSPLTIALGKDIQGKVMLTRLDKMPHLLIAGATGSGKSSCLNSLLISLMYKASPSDVRLILIDPKRVEFTAYNGLPHMLIENAITDVKEAIGAFKWACDEMEKRYLVLQSNCVRDIYEYNSLPAVKEGVLPKMHFIVVIVDELANLIMSSKADKKTLEDAIVAIASKARAAGIHLVLATQRPSVDVITGTIKANLPSRIAFAVSTMQDSRIILDGGGAEALLGRGDMLYAPLNESEETRIQGAFVENFEVKSIVDFVKTNNTSDFDDEFATAIKPKEATTTNGGSADEADGGSQYDKEFPDVVRCVIRSGKASSALIQRRFRFGWNKAARIMEQMEELHFVGPQEGGAKSREIYVTPEKFEEFFGEKYEQ